MWTKQYKKALTWTFDDGVTQDVRLAQLLNQYGMKATFNVNTSFSSATPPFEDEGISIHHLDHEELRLRLVGHEIALHGHVHANLTLLNDSQIISEMEVNRLEIERLYGKTPLGMAYAFGNHDKRVEQVLSSLPIHYARTIESTMDFDFPKNMLAWNPSVSISDPRLEELVDKFVEIQTDDHLLLSIWGHSYELDARNTWKKLERILMKLAGRNDIFYGTNSEVLLEIDNSI